MKNALDTTFDHKDPYKILGVSADAAPAAIHRAYLQLAKRNHQDLFANDPEKYRSSTRLMQDINAAYELLSDPSKREFWNRRHLGAPRKAAQQAEQPAAPAPSARYKSELAQMVIQAYTWYGHDVPPWSQGCLGNPFIPQRASCSYFVLEKCKDRATL